MPPCTSSAHHEGLQRLRASHAHVLLHILLHVLCLDLCHGWTDSGRSGRQGSVWCGEAGGLKLQFGPASAACPLRATRCGRSVGRSVPSESQPTNTDAPTHPSPALGQGREAMAVGKSLARLRSAKLALATALRQHAWHKSDQPGPSPGSAAAAAAAAVPAPPPLPSPPHDPSLAPKKPRRQLRKPKPSGTEAGAGAAAAPSAGHATAGAALFGGLLFLAGGRAVDRGGTRLHFICGGLCWVPLGDTQATAPAL